MPATMETGTQWNGAQVVCLWGIGDGLTKEVTLELELKC